MAKQNQSDTSKTGSNRQTDIDNTTDARHGEDIDDIVPENELESADVNQP